MKNYVVLTVTVFVFYLSTGVVPSACEVVPQYLYPVATVDGTDSFFVVCQWSLDRLELYEWSLAKNIGTKVIPTMYTPAAVRILSDGSGVGFVDNGRIRIKHFNVRSVKTIDIYEPIYDIECVEWLDARNCYFHAQCDGRWGVYGLDLEGHLAKLVETSNSIDYFYPYLVGDNIFCIERARSDDYSFNYRIVGWNYDCQRQLATKRFIIADFGHRYILLLHMSSPCRGWVLESRGFRGNDHEFLDFAFNEVFSNGGVWKTEKLFEFTLPSSLVSHSAQGLYESLLPIVPRLIGDSFYYASCLSGSTLNVYSYERATGHAQRCLAIVGQHVFPPILVGSLLVYGGSGARLQTQNYCRSWQTDGATSRATQK